MTSRHTAHYHFGSRSFASVPAKRLRLRLRLPHPWPCCECFLLAGVPTLAGVASPLVAAPDLQAAFALATGGLSPSSRRVLLRSLNISYGLFLLGLLCPGVATSAVHAPGGGTTYILTLFTMMPRLSRRRFLNRFHTLIGSDDPPDVSVGWCPPTEHTYSLQKEAFRPSMTSPFMSNGFRSPAPYRCAGVARCLGDHGIDKKTLYRHFRDELDTAADLANAANRQRRLFCSAVRRSSGGMLLAQVPGWLEGSSKL